MHEAFEREFDKKSYEAPKYTELQILEVFMHFISFSFSISFHFVVWLIQKQILWIGNVKDKLKDNPFLAEQAFESMEAQEAYLEEFKLQLDE